MTNPLRFIARVVIEFRTAFLVGAGEGDLFSDAICVVDANGVPAIPGSSIAGILRHVLTSAWGGDQIDSVFGYQKGQNGVGSRLTVSWGCLHDSEGKPVEGLIVGGRLDDPLIQNARAGILRDHVRIGHRGVVDPKGKFDERVVPAGHRFTFDLLLEGAEEDKKLWSNILTTLLAPGLRLGGKTRRGFGSVEVVSLFSATFNLSTEEGWKSFAAMPVSLADPKPKCLSDAKEELKKRSSDPFPTEVVTAELDLEPEGFWMFGGGKGTEADMTPVLEPRIIWDEATGKGTVGAEMLLIPGSSVKGAIAHRVAFHYNAIKKNFADGKSSDEIKGMTAAANGAVKVLFGSPPNRKEKNPPADSDRGARGRVLIDDLHIPHIPADRKFVNHVSLDRFTGGARSGLLFNEMPVHGGGPIPLKVVVLEAKDDEVTPEVRKALRLAIADLAEGRLALGAGAGRGNGYFKAKKVEWSDKSWEQEVGL